MTPQEPIPLLDAQALRALVRGLPGQCGCALKACQGWESVSDERWPAQQMRQAVGAAFVFAVGHGLAGAGHDEGGPVGPVVERQ